jgi:signal transduction histidine kinase
MDVGIELKLQSECFAAACAEVLAHERSSAVQEERRRLADDLHDIVAAHLNVAGVFLAAAKQSLPPGEANEFIAAAETGIRDCWRDVRRCAAGLRPLELDDHGLAVILGNYARRLSAGGGISVTVVFFGTSTPLPQDTELALLRVAQEAATNAIRHGRATAISIQLEYEANRVRLEVTDNGAGFDVTHAPEGLGLLSMRARAKQVGAELAIHAEPAHGTQVIMIVPLDRSSQQQMSLRPKRPAGNDVF